jgi:signal transduction histidine kinase/ActR/RegA family two-component response regulator
MKLFAMNKLFLSVCVVSIAIFSSASAEDNSSVQQESLSKDASTVLVDIQSARAYLSRHPEESRLVELEGVVTCVHYWRTGFLVGNEEGLVIPCDMPLQVKNHSVPIKFGDRIFMKGKTVSRKFLIDVSSVEIIGHADSIPSRPVLFVDGTPQLFGSAYYRTEGIVHEIAHRKNEINLFVHTQNGRIAISYRFHEPITEDLRTWLGQKFRIEGNAKQVASPDIGKLQSILMCSDRSQIQLIDNHSECIDSQSRELKARTFGVVEWVEMDKNLLIEGRRVKTDLSRCFRAGDRVEISRSLTSEQGSPFLHAKISGQGPLPPVKVLDIRTAAKIVPDLHSTSITGIVSEWNRMPLHWTCVVRANNEQIKAVFLASSFADSERPFEKLPSGSLIRLRGVMDRNLPDSSPSLFQLRVGRIEDAVLLRDVASLKSDKLLFALAIISSLVAALLLWIVSLKQQVRSRTRALKLAQEEQFRVEKLNAVARLAGGIAHDFNNLLTAVSANLCLAEIEAHDPNKLRNRVAVASSAVERAARLTRYLLDFSRQTPLDLQPTSVGEVIEQAAELMRHTLSPAVQFSCIVDENLHYCLADGLRLEQVLLNLCFNARDALRNNSGSIAIRATNDFHRQLGKCVRITVEDNGVGMSLDVQSNIYEPFFTTKAVGSGTGLGLSTALGIVEQHKGKIDCHSVLGNGTRFDIYLPITFCDRPLVRIENKRPSVARIQGMRPLQILLVDDEPFLRDSNSQLLSALNHVVAQAENGKIAIDLLRRNPVFDLVLLDLTMPVMSGSEALKLIKAEFPHVRVVICSGYASESHALDSGSNSVKPDGFLEKPFTMEALAKILNDCSSSSNSIRRAA